MPYAFKYVAAQFIIFALAFAVYAWCDVLTFCNYASHMIVVLVICYVLVFKKYRKEKLRRHKEKMNSCERAKQPWE